MTGELAKEGGNIKALWSRLKKSDLQTTVWCGSSAYVFAPTGPSASDYIQIALGRESEFRDGPVVNRESRLRRREELLDPIWRGWDQPREEDRLVGPIDCLVNRRGGDVVHMGSFLERCGGYERDRRETPGSKMEQKRIVREAGADGMRERSLLETVSDLEWVPPEVRFFQDWQQTSAGSQRVFAHWALDIMTIVSSKANVRLGSFRVRCGSQENGCSLRETGLYIPCWTV